MRVLMRAWRLMLSSLEAASSSSSMEEVKSTLTRWMTCSAKPFSKRARADFLVLDLGRMEVTLHIPDDIAKRLSAAGGDVSRRALEALALEGYSGQTLTLYEVSEMLGLSRIETEDFLGRHHVPLAVIGEADLDREAALFEAASRRNPR